MCMYMHVRMNVYVYVWPTSAGAVLLLMSTTNMLSCDWLTTYAKSSCTVTSLAPEKPASVLTRTGCALSLMSNTDSMPAYYSYWLPACPAPRRVASTRRGRRDATSASTAPPGKKMLTKPTFLISNSEIK